MLDLLSRRKLDEDAVRIKDNKFRSSSFIKITGLPNCADIEKYDQVVNKEWFDHIDCVEKY